MSRTAGVPPSGSLSSREILEIAETLDEASDRLAGVLERSGADALHPPDVLREMVRYELDLAAVDVATLTFGTEIRKRWR
jgi:hypothetical protein